MKRRQRLMATLRGEPVDRPPVSFYEIGGWKMKPDPNDAFAVWNDPSWRPLVERFIADLRAGGLQVLENTPFGGGHFPRWVNETSGESGCAVAIEFKKTFMNEWTGEPDNARIEALRQALASTVSGVLVTAGRGSDVGRSAALPTGCCGEPAYRYLR